MTEYEKLNSIKTGEIVINKHFTTSQNEKEHNKKTKPKRFIGFSLCLILIFAFGFGTGQLYPSLFENKSFENISQQNNPIQDVNIINTASLVSNNSIVDIVKEVGPSVVNITTKVAVRDFFNNTYLSDGAGSGVIIEQDNENIYIMTNAHVINNTKELLVTLSNGEEIPAIVKGADTQTDLAVIQIKKNDVKDLSYIKISKLGDSDNIQVGETAIAMGNALGYNNTVTVGVVSALNRQVTVDQKTLTLIQTDAAINPGNSGGALVNIYGEVIGINSVKITERDVEGFGFAIPINNAKPIIESLLKNGYVERPYLGIQGVDVTKAKSELTDLPVGIFVSYVEPDSAAYFAGIKERDIIISLDDKITYTMEDLKKLIDSHSVGDTVKIKIIRNNKKLSLNAKLQNLSKPAF